MRCTYITWAEVEICRPVTDIIMHKIEISTLAFLGIKGL